MAEQSARPLGKVKGVGEVRGPDGKLKGIIHFEGTTELSEEELRRRLQPSDEPKKEDK